jgi:cobalt/nickel transport system ATP-binding protein
VSPLIEVAGLRYRYDDGAVALDGVDFRLYPGETVALLGPNGSGKTTFVLNLNGLLSGEGVVRVGGLERTREHLDEIRRRIGIVFQDSDTQLFMPAVLDDVAFGLLSRGVDPDRAVELARAALRQVGMESAAGKAPYHLSAGEKKRVAIAGILAMTPEVLVLDEPTTFLDPPAQRALSALLRNLPQAKILVTHDVPFARAICSRAVFFQRGRIAGEGTVDEMACRFDWNP